MTLSSSPTCGHVTGSESRYRPQARAHRHIDGRVGWVFGYPVLLVQGVSSHGD
jgi:hypothetical protein